MTADSNANTKKRGLGRGLDALFQDARAEEKSFEPKMKRADEIVAATLAAQTPSAPAQRQLPVSKLRPGKFQPRRHFDETALEQLAESIAMHGVMQPLLVRPVASGMYEIVAGERRWRAAQKAKIHEVPVIIKELDDNTTLEMALIENLQREGLSALEEAEGYQRLIDEFHHTQDVLSHNIGKSRSHIANTLRLLKLPNKVKKYMQEGALSAGHARALLGCNDAESIAEAVVRRGLSVRQTEKLVQGMTAGKTKAKKSPKSVPKNFWKDVDVLALEEKVSAQLGMRVSIDSVGATGTLGIEYKSLEQLDDLLARLAKTPRI